MADDLEQKLSAAGERLARADEERDAAMRAVGDLVRAAHGQIAITRVAELAGISRPTVYKLQKG